MTAKPATPEAVLVIKHGAFGDVMQSDGALRDIRAHHPRERIVALTTAPFRTVFERNPFVDEVIVDSRAPRWRVDRMVALRRQIRAAGVTRVYDLQTSRRTAFYRTWLLSGLPWIGARRELTWRLTPKPVETSALERMASDLRRAGVPVSHTPRPDVRWMAEDVSDVLGAVGLAQKPYVMLIAGSSARHPQKRWPHYQALARALLARGFDVLTAPGPDERDLARTMPGTVLPGPLTLFQLAGVIGNAAFIVGNDTGPIHLAAHSGVPGLALFGPYFAPALTGVAREGFEVIAAADLAALSVEQVLAAVLERYRAPA